MIKKRGSKRVGIGGLKCEIETLKETICEFQGRNDEKFAAVRRSQASILRILNALKKQGECIMHAQKEMTDQLNAVKNELDGVKGQLEKVAVEEAKLQETITAQAAKITELTTVVEGLDVITPELQAALDGVKASTAAVKAQAKVLDDLVPDVNPPA